MAGGLPVYRIPKVIDELQGKRLVQLYFCGGYCHITVLTDLVKSF